jgi:hypothetical protein
MKNWFQNNLKNIIITAFVVPILLVAFVSISHVTTFYGLSNPITWAVYLSVGIEIAALSALAAVSVNMGRFVYVPFFIVTLIQMIGNIFFSFTYIDETGQSFQDWVAMVGGLFENMGVEKTDLNSHKTILSFLSGGLLPIISLTFAHMLVKFSEKNEDNLKPKQDEVIDIDTLIKEKVIEDENLKYNPTKEDLEKLENILKKYENETESTNDLNVSEEVKDEETIQEEIINEEVIQEDLTDEELIEKNPFGEHYSEYESIENKEVEEIVEGVTGSHLNPEFLDEENKILKYLKLNKNG